ncbi:hypothetical protein GUITHDRAFT_153855 [Guillardia theta CCMP2712]|uniref:Uncharacterized protein n=1 Tax=Guillardia theta (strain CCMP2712) TaxID=905079 RepID=L1IYT0_GUITC|nr:hypothetical protein GUITHDRAFT_153855 [Guillardia theta CCMP2712]EKX41386.1 hypothetical protein GUITHDRAFT_153855 [Guillardia theta CCMP2712]|eukprot:XP_005828366.1 hypothetical protein GUITHDRAFT_153855 [Guillardia theta CCMP2712]
MARVVLILAALVRPSPALPQLAVSFAPPPGLSFLLSPSSLCRARRCQPSQLHSFRTRLRAELRDSDDDISAYGGNATSSGRTGVLGKVGLEKSEGLPLPLVSSRPRDGRDSILEQERGILGIFGEESVLKQGLVGVALLFILYLVIGRMYISSPMNRYQVVERYEDAYICYGIPSPDDPTGSVTAAKAS